VAFYIVFRLAEDYLLPPKIIGIETLVRSQMPAVQRRMLLDMAVFGSRLLGDVLPTGFRSVHSFVRHVDHSSCYY